MWKRVIGAGLLAGAALFVWTVVLDGLLGFRARIDLKQVPAERQVYETLKQHIVDPGRYTVNPALTADQRFPEGEPVFGVLYGGVGHEAAGRFMLTGVALFLIAPVLGAWLLSRMSAEVLSSYPRKVAFFVGIGLLIALSSDLASAGIGGYPLGDALKLAARRVADWTLVGLVIAWQIGRARGEAAEARPL